MTLALSRLCLVFGDTLERCNKGSLFSARDLTGSHFETIEIDCGKERTIMRECARLVKTMRHC